MEQLNKKKEGPKVGIIIPCHNYGEYVVDALDSAICQDYSGEIYVFVVDDCSTDKSVQTLISTFKNQNEWQETEDGHDYIKSTVSDNRHVCLFLLPNPTGPSNARNVGIDLAFKEGCEVIAFLDADDMMVTNKISQLVPELEEFDAVYADYYHLYPDGNYRIELKEIFDYERFIQENIGPNNTSLVTRRALEAIKEDSYFNTNMRTCEDYDLFMRVAEKFRIRHVPEPLTFLRVHDNNSTSTVNQEIWQKDRRKVNERIIERQNQGK